MLSKGSSHGHQQLIRAHVSLENQLATQMKTISRMESQMRELQKKIKGLEDENDFLHESLAQTDNKMEWLDKTVHELMPVKGHHELPPQDDFDDPYSGWGDDEFREYDENGNEITNPQE